MDCLVITNYRLYQSVIVIIRNELICDAGFQLKINGVEPLNSISMSVGLDLVFFIKKGSVIDANLPQGIPEIIRVDDSIVHRIIKEGVHTANNVAELSVHAEVPAFLFRVVSKVDLCIASMLLNSLSSISESDAGMTGALCGYHGMMVILGGFGEDFYRLLLSVSKLNVIDRVRTIIMRDVSKRWKLSDISDALHVSEVSLKKSLEKEGISFTDLLWDIRMRESLVLIVNSDCKVDKVARDVGYSSTSYFIKNFKEYFGVSPKKISAEFKIF